MTFRPDPQDGFDSVDAAAYDANAQDRALWAAPALVCCECGGHAEGNAECEGGELCDACCRDDVDDDYATSDEPYDMTDAEADADTLASAGYGTDEDYGGYDYYDEY